MRRSCSPLLLSSSSTSGDPDAANGTGTAVPTTAASSSTGDDTTIIEFLDCHHHFYDTSRNDFQTFLSRFQPDASYLPADYDRDVVRHLRDDDDDDRRLNLRHVGSVHVEAMPDDGVSEVRWVVDSLGTATSTVRAVVASCDLAGDEDDVDAALRRLREASPKVRGVRWILDRVEEPGSEATHAGNLRHDDGVDYLRDTRAAPAFERGFALLARHGLSFDLQCAPEQLPAAAALCARHPDVPVVINHLGKPLRLLGPNNSYMTPDEEKLQEWRHGMALLAALPHVYVKISMLGWIVPGWIRSARRIDLVRRLCRETVAMFGPERCMVNTNMWKDYAASDSDGLSDVGPTAAEYLEYLSTDFFADLTLEERRLLFAGTARKFYRLLY